MKKSHKREKFSVSSIAAALQLYDGCEFDVRFTKDRVLVLYHDAKYNCRRLLDTAFRELKGVQTLEELIYHPQVIDMVNNRGKTLWVEAKEDSRLGLKRDIDYCEDIARKIFNLLSRSELRLGNIRIISFSPDILKGINGIRTLRIIPYLFSTTDSFIPRYNLKTAGQMLTSLRRHILNTKKMGIGGLLFSKLYLKGLFSFFQPSLEEVKSLETNDFILGTDAQTLKEEKLFKEFVVITDFLGERRGGRGESAGPLICHRGL